MSHVDGGRAAARKDILTTLYYPRRRAWVERAELIDPASVTRRDLLRRLLRESRDYRALVLNGGVGLRGGYVDLVAAAAVGRRTRAPLVVLSECAWKRKTGVRRLVRRVSAEAIDNPRVVYCVLSTAELAAVPETWGVPPERVVFTPYCHSLTDEELERPDEDDGSVFAGGNALRDYEPLLASARDLPDVRFRVRTDNALGRDAAGLPPNVETASARHGTFMDALRRARVVVVPFRAGVERAAGLLTYLSAMALGKVVVVTEAPGARDYVADGETGFVVPPADAAALAERLRWILDPVNDEEVRRIAASAAAVARTRFHPDRYVEHLLEVVDRFR